METIFDYITAQKVAYDKPVELSEGWYWSMKEHLNRSFLYLNSQFEQENDNRTLRPFKNIVLPILNIQFRIEGFDVKDIEIYADNADDYYKSLLIKKYHDNWALEHQIDTFIDEVVESYCTYGGALVRKTKGAKPEVIDLRTIVFCNQYDLLNHPFGILHRMSFSQLRREAKKRNWGSEGADIDIETLISLVKKQSEDKDDIEIYEVHGSMPKEWLSGEQVVDESEMDVNQIQVVAFYRDDKGHEQGVCLFKKEMPTLPFKFLKRDDVKNRALGRGGVEEIFEGQTWTNWNEVKVTEMRDSASKTLFASDDPTFKSRNNLNNAQNNEVFSLGEGKQIAQIDTFPRNLAVFNESTDRFFQHAQMIGSASDPLLGEEPSSGTPFKLYEAQQIESRGMHKYRQGKLATFMDEIYRDWIIPQLAKEIVKEQNFMQELSADEMQLVVDKVVTKKANEFKKRMIFAMQDIDEDMVNLYKQQVQADVVKKGNRRFFEILADEMKDVTLSVMTNIAGKQRNLALLTDKLVDVLRQYIATPQLRQDPEMTKLLNTILESSGLSPIVFGSSPMMGQQMAPAMAGGTGSAPLGALGQQQQEQQA